MYRLNPELQTIEQEIRLAPDLMELVKERLHQIDAAGKFISVITGEETDDELRKIAIHILTHCRGKCSARTCPFVLLHHLSLNSMKDVLSTMRRKDLLELFAEETILRQAHLHWRR